MSIQMRLESDPAEVTMNIAPVNDAPVVHDVEVEIDEDKCNGCGLCIPDCHEGALRIVNGKAKLVSELYCDGLGNCLGHCPEDAIFRVNKEQHAIGRYVDTDYGKCVGCHICAEVCPSGYIKMGLGG